MLIRHPFFVDLVRRAREGSRNLSKPKRSAILLLGIVTLIGLLAPLVAPFPPNKSVALSLQNPSGRYWFGTDELGRDVFSRVLFGARYSLEIAAGAVAISGLIGVSSGLYAGYYLGWRDNAIMRAMDFALGFPALILALIVVALFGLGEFAPLAAAAVVNIPLFARVVRAATLSERHKEYVLAVRALGAGPSHVMFRTILKAILPIVWIQAAIAAALSIQLEAALSFLGVGVPPPSPSLGSMLESALGYLYTSPFYAIFPGVVLSLLVGSFVVLSTNAEQPRSWGGRTLEPQFAETFQGDA